MDEIIAYASETEEYALSNYSIQLLRAYTAHLSQVDEMIEDKLVGW